MKKYNWSNKYVSIFLLIAIVTLLLQVSIMLFTESKTAIYHVIFWGLWSSFLICVLIVRKYKYKTLKQDPCKNIIARNNLMNEEGYSPYCGGNCREMPRTKFNRTLGQFFCSCGWISKFPEDFIKEYKTKWNIK